MIRKTKKRFENTTMVIEGKTIRWDDHMIQISNISQIWLGNCFKERLPVYLVLILFYIALSGVIPVNTIVMLLALIIYMLIWSYRYWKQKDTKDINFEINSGNVYSFISNNEDFTCQVFELICDLITENNSINTNLCIHFNGDGNIVDNSITVEETVEDSTTVKETSVEDSTAAEEKKINKQLFKIQSINTDNQLIIDLQKLAMNYASNKEANGEFIDLIEKTIHLLDTDDKETMKKVYSQFVILGLIKDCNKLGLITLIQAIRKNVYQSDMK